MDVGPGDLVLCVRDGSDVHGYSPLYVGAIYTIVEVGRRGGFKLAEVECPMFPGCTGYFSSDLFRPIRKPPIPAEILALQNTLPASPEPVPA